MQDLHVVALRYRLETEAGISFESPPALVFENNLLRMTLDGGQSILQLKDHFPTIEAARNAVEKFLRSWELDIALSYGRREIRFIFEDAELIDRIPAPPGSGRLIQLLGAATLVMSALASLHVTRHQYPAPPLHFQASPDVETLWHRFEGYTQGREPLPSMGYFCLTLIETRAGNRAKAAQHYRIDKDILDKLGELTSTSSLSERTWYASKSHDI